MGLCMKKDINVAARSITFTFDGLDSITMHTEKMSTANYDYACLHGMAARIGDSAALTKRAENNFTVTEAMRRAEVAAMVEFYENAENKDWTLKVRTAKIAINPTWAKMAELSGRPYEEIAAQMAQRDIEELMKMTNMRDVRHGE